jgi:Predicted ATPase
VTDGWYVITAGPSAGKSSVIRELSSRGYKTLPEAARILFDQTISEGGSPEQKRQEDDFHKQVESIDRRMERNISENEIVFMDRSLADNIAYRQHFGNHRCRRYHELQAECNSRYDKVFVLDRLNFEDDEVRVEDEQEAQEIHETILRVYNNLNCDVHSIEVMPVSERADRIESLIL